MTFANEFATLILTLLFAVLILHAVKGATQSGNAGGALTGSTKWAISKFTTAGNT